MTQGYLQVGDSISLRSGMLLSNQVSGKEHWDLGPFHDLTAVEGCRNQGSMQRSTRVRDIFVSDLQRVLMNLPEHLSEKGVQMVLV